MPFPLKMAGTSCTDDARLKVLSFQKVTVFFYSMRYSTETPSICIFVCLKMFLTATIKDAHASNDSLQSDSSFLLRNSMMTTLPAAKSLKFSYLHAIYIGCWHCSVRLTICDTVLKFSAIVYYY